ncbi:inner membrane protein, Sco2p [Trichosporon asahii var. asahii CBS 2479]|uniref:Inner membrane protein, Sco2p n=1 Tax=Trichosporon asahii var. asahii (strain ATCC 90039 / CBS 2479 / JCM 2466 / KCTC 7840 / NBRC 103889/ NCYC 2677 / UAMH 7654) TaxID=1186058 RepID=J6EXU8_TRIAS|nr:inner membrane protein, Sco2p [Trichosporon asahii var. asahii CBS 2479]EJT49474.1 inner membrane protein, Sco2p [Trichosporon asahii var. asahii CBS 2479]
MFRTGLRATARITPAVRPAAARAPLAAVPRFSRGYAQNESSEASSQAKDRAAVGPFTWKAAGLFIVTGAALYYYFTEEKKKVLERRRQELETKSVGRPQIGGPFNLVDQNGKPFTDADLKGKFTLIYFGFTHCPDICPEELDKMSDVVDTIDKEHPGKDIVTPVFVSVDPARDSVPQVKAYVQEFHPRIIGLTGDYDNVKKACKSYRVYFSTPPDAKATDDYLVDHSANKTPPYRPPSFVAGFVANSSIFFYLMDPLGQFVDAFGKSTTPEEVTEKVRDAIGKWEAAGGNKAAGLE